MFDKLFGIMKRVDRKQEYTITPEGDVNRPYFATRADVSIGDKKLPCDTAIDLDIGQPSGSEKVTFTTLIQGGVSGENEVVFNKVVDVLNNSFPGKFFRDVSDGSEDLLYSTSERLKGMTPKVVVENIDHHAQVKARVSPELEHLTEKLGLEPKQSVSDADQFVLNWNKVFIETNNLPNPPEIKYLPGVKKK